MKKIILRVLCVALCITMALLSLTGCVIVGFSGTGLDSVTGTGNLERFEFKTGDITQIQIMMYCNVELYSAASDTVTLDIQPNLMEYVTVDTSPDGVLTLRASRPVSYSGTSNTPVLTVSSPVLNSIIYQGAGKFTAHDTITADSFNISISGASECIIGMQVNHLGAEILGAGSLNLSGTADRADITLSGAGNVKALSLQTRETYITMTGAGSVEVASSDKLCITASGAGSVQYKGSPSLDISRSGMVSIRQVD